MAWSLYKHGVFTKSIPIPFFNEFADFSNHLSSLAASVTRALGSIINKCKQHNYMSYSTYSKLVQSCVFSVLDYGSEIWGIYKYDQIQRVQNNAARVFLGLNKFAPILSIQGDIGWNFCKTRIDVNILRFWNRIINMEPSRICKHVFLWDYNIQNSNWTYFVSTIFDKVNLDNFDMQIECNLIDCLRKLEFLYNIEWCNKLVFKPKLRTYKMFKSHKYTENYVKFNLSCKERSMLAKFRMGVLPINIEVGRYRNISVDQRFCYNCVTEIEDEIHFLLVCPVYENERVVLLSTTQNDSSFNNLNRFEKILYLVIIILASWLNLFVVHMNISNH